MPAARDAADASGQRTALQLAEAGDEAEEKEEGKIATEATPGRTTAPSLDEELAQLAQLRDDGVITEAQFEKEYDQLERTINEEKKKQLANMRAAMLNRRIAKEQKRKQAEKEADEEHSNH